MSSLDFELDYEAMYGNNYVQKDNHVILDDVNPPEATSMETHKTNVTSLFKDIVMKPMDEDTKLNQVPDTLEDISVDTELSKVIDDALSSECFEDTRDIHEDPAKDDVSDEPMKAQQAKVDYSISDLLRAELKRVNPTMFDRLLVKAMTVVSGASRRFK